jgi:hypothetical protein
MVCPWARQMDLRTAPPTGQRMVRQTALRMGLLSELLMGRWCGPLSA